MMNPAYFMNVSTGSVDVADGWDDFDACRANDILVEVRETTEEESEEYGEWIAV